MSYRFCNDCGERHGNCKCKECADCGGLADARCEECSGHFCDAHLHTRPGYSHTMRWCERCRDWLATFVACANTDPSRKCKTLTFAPERLHECAACHQDFCPKCIATTPLPGAIFQAQYHCPSCHAQQKAAAAA